MQIEVVLAIIALCIPTILLPAILGILMVKGSFGNKALPMGVSMLIIAIWMATTIFSEIHKAHPFYINNINSVQQAKPDCEKPNDPVQPPARREPEQ